VSFQLYKPGEIDHGDLKDTNFEDDRQPEIAIWRSNRKYLYLRKYDRHHQNSNGKLVIFDHDESTKVQPSDCDNEE